MPYRKVTFLDGEMGAGKTANSMDAVFEFHWNGWPIWVNQPMKMYPPIPKKAQGVHAPIFYFTDLEDILAMGGYMRRTFGWPDGPEWDRCEGLVVADEAALLVNNRGFKDFSPKLLMAFTHMRKLHLSALMIAQSFTMTDLNVRRIGHSVRTFDGSTILTGGRRYPYTEYRIDREGKIIKNLEPTEYVSASYGANWLDKRVYNAYDTDYVFGDLPVKMWPSAIGYVPPPLIH